MSTTPRPPAPDRTADRDDAQNAAQIAAHIAAQHAAASAEIRMLPDDTHNRTLISHVAPRDWVNPTPDGRYNMVVIGAGTAGLVTAVGAAGLGAKVALIEKNMMGGDCLNVGCVPSKALISAAKRAAEVRDAADFGVDVPEGVRVNFPRVMERMRELRARIAPNDSAARFRDLGVDIYLGGGRFTSANTVEVAGQTLEFAKACIATGGRAAAPPIPGLAEVEHLTNENLFELTELPERLAVIGSGPIGCEMAQSFARFGSQVTLIEMGPHILMREDEDAAAIVQRAFQKDGVQLLMGAKTTAVREEQGEKLIDYELDGTTHTLRCDAILVGVGRAPNVNGLGLDAAGVRFDTNTGVVVDDNLRTSNPSVFAAGDVASQYKFTHTADFLARIVIQNALFPGPKGKASALTVPWATFTDPEVAHVGMYVADAEQAGLEVDTYTQDFADVDRAILDGEDDGFVKIHVKRGSDKILGATIVARHAGEMISEISVAMKAGMGLGGLASVIHPYPTQADAIRRAGDAYNRTRLTPLVATLMEKWLRFTR
ncbi:MAG: mercuric reductase [Planctomycetota bacterium]|nr:MAG: mercuric reductase [Planctomycetota bacterium]